MKEELVKQQATNQIATFDVKKVSEYLESQGLLNIPKKYQTQFVELAQAYGLNPFKREIYAVGYGDKWSIITGYEVYLKRAEDSGLLDGWEVTATGSVENGDLEAIITIYRSDRKYPFKHSVMYSECVNTNSKGEPNSVWAKQPVFMTKKVAIAQGFRLCFPREMGGMPYTSDEVQVQDAEAIEIKETPQISDELKDEWLAAMENCKTEAEVKTAYNLDKFLILRKDAACMWIMSKVLKSIREKATTTTKKSKSAKVETVEADVITDDVVAEVQAAELAAMAAYQQSQNQ